MKINNRVVLAAFALLVFGLIGSQIGKVRSQPQILRSLGSTQPVQIDTGAFPVVSFDRNDVNETQAGLTDEKRGKRNEKFDRFNFVEASPDIGVTMVTRTSHWHIGLPALPVNRSSAVVIGTITSSKAFLSNDKSGVYSEFAIQIEKIVKENQKQRILKNENIEIIRPGGVVRYSSGQLVKYLISGQRMPRVNGRYTLFLEFDEIRSIYSILTGYEMINGKVSPLDGRNEAKKSGFDGFQAYDGVDELRFLNDLQSAMYGSSETQTENATP